MLTLYGLDILGWPLYDLQRQRLKSSTSQPHIYRLI